VSPQDHRTFPSDRIETIRSRSYRNEAVEIDGKMFDRCTFVNITFVYRGLGPTTFIGATFSGTTILQTDNAAARGMMVLSDFLRTAPGVETFSLIEKDPLGNLKIITTEKRLQ